MTVVPSRSRPLPTEEAEVDFASLGLIEPLLRAIRKAGYQKATPIQASAIPPALDGRDVLGAAQTGTGKTAAFSLPLLQHLSQQERSRGDRRPVRALILSPTHELASQIEDCIATYGQCVDIRQTVIFGGVSANNQVRELKLGIDVLVATPGRLWDLLSQKLVDLSQVQVLVLDEVDRMLDQGFWPTVRKIVAKVPKKRQTLAFSATMPDALKPLIDELLINPVRVSVAKVSSTPQEIDQTVHFVPDPTHKRALLADLVSDEAMERVIVFTKTKHGANRVTKHLDSSGIRAEAIHGNKSQNARERALEGFKQGDVRVLVATDIAARGLDIKGISHVVNYDLPVDAESYVHRIGRTARAGTSGVAISLCSHEERPLLVRIERLIGRRVPVAAERPRAQSNRRVEVVASSDERRAYDPRGQRDERAHDDQRSRGPRVQQRAEPRVREQRKPEGLRASAQGRDERRGPRETSTLAREGLRARERQPEPSVREVRRDEPRVRELRRDEPRVRELRRDEPRVRELRRDEPRARDEQVQREPARAVRRDQDVRDDRRETPVAFAEPRDALRSRDDRHAHDAAPRERRELPVGARSLPERSRQARPQRGQVDEAPRRQDKPRSAY
jgi:ATP-dependent RNA helicase RhlE